MRPNSVPMPRDMPGYVVNYFRARVLWTDAIGGGKPIGLLPTGAMLLPCYSRIITPFNGTTPIVSAGTDGPQSNILGAIVPTAAAGTVVVSVTGQSLIFGSPTPLFVRGVFAGAITQGELTIVIPFVTDDDQ